jgi:hypothetical protein
MPFHILRLFTYIAQIIDGEFFVKKDY